METSEKTPEIVPTPQLEEAINNQETDSRSKRIVTIIIIGVVVLLALLGIAIYFLLQPGTPTDR
ncbi:MAG TPA: hypothetical protein VFY66_09495, partial [Anaerolineales bacterium]|nr:hypothetical protein [Anaerolineales bacterium]